MKTHDTYKNTLVADYLPVDYIDSFSRDIQGATITPDEFFDRAFKQFPGWINALMKLRNALVRPLGLDTQTRFTDKICGKNASEIIFGMPDKHLTFYVSLWCGAEKNGRQKLKITTLVNYNNRLGRFYFFIIRPFHKIIVCSILKKVEKLGNKIT